MAQRRLRVLRGGIKGAHRVSATALPAGVVTFLFTDVEGSTRLLRTAGERFAEQLEAHNGIIRTAISAHGGHEVRTGGDSFFCAFPDPARALATCLGAQLALRKHPWPAGMEIRVRMGLHTGQAQLGGDDYISLAVHQAARVADAAHGGQVLVSEATRLLVAETLPAGATLQLLGGYRLKDFPGPTQLYQLCHPALQAEFPSLRALPAAAHNVPEQTTLFVNRNADIAALRELVVSRRLVSVLGPGGVGKTRLAIEAVPVVVPHFPDGVWLIELAPLGNGEAVASEVSAAVGVPAEAERHVADTLSDALAAKRLLLVLDNCEHVLEDTAALVELLVGRCPDVHVLATSREPLGLRGETRYALSPLSLPASAEAVDVEASEAVALFADRAQAVAPGFEVASERKAVAEICRRLDGLPLAIELAAARAASIPVGRIAARLDRRFSVLQRSYTGALSHHETLRGSIEWSHDLLDPPERVLLRRLAVFTGEFDLEAVEAICGRPPLTDDDILDLLVRLVEKSLVHRSNERYVLLESIREFAQEQLQPAHEAEEIAVAHLEHYTSVVEAAAIEADGPNQREAYDRLDADLGNIRAAVERALARSDQRALRLGAALAQYGFIRNRLAEVARWCIDAVAAAPDAPAALRARALTQAGFALVVMGSPERGHGLVDDGLTMARSAGDRELLVQTLLMAADLRLEAGQETEARPLASEALRLVSTAGADWTRARALVVAARADQDEAGYAETHERLAQALGLFERAGDRRQAARVLLTMAYLSLEAGELEAAEAEAGQCFSICEELEHPIGQAVARVVQVWTAIDRGELEVAGTLLSETISTARDSGYRALLGYCVAAAATLSAAQSKPVEAARLLGALASADSALGGEGARVTRRRADTLRAVLEQRLGAAELASHIQDGARLTLEEIAAERL
jgi:predicted ATPase/class 3 adenylate cyclase